MVLLFHKVVYFITKHIMGVVFFFQGFRWKRYKTQAKHYLVLTNHTTNSDSFYAGMGLRRHMYFVAGENVLRIPVGGPLIRFFTAPIYRKKGASGAEASAQIVKRVKKGSNVCITIEGNKSFDGVTTTISPNTAKLIRDCGVSVITIKIHGGYMVQPRWSDVKRHGRIWTEVAHEYSTDEIASLSDDELNKRILEDIYVNAYEDQKEKMYIYKGKALAQGIERILFMCPKCHGISTIHSHVNTASCSECGLELKFDEYGFFHSEDTAFTTVYDWNKWQKEELVKLLEKVKDGEKVFETKPVYSLYQLNGNNSKKAIEYSTFDIYKDRIVFGNHTFMLKDVEHFSLSMSCKALFSTSDGNYWQIKSDTMDSMVKYLFAVQYFQGKPLLLR